MTQILWLKNEMTCPWCGAHEVLQTSSVNRPDKEIRFRCECCLKHWWASDPVPKEPDIGQEQQFEDERDPLDYWNW